jgi:Peptidase M15
MVRTVIAAAAAAAIVQLAVGAAPARTRFAVEAKGHTFTARVASVFVLPGERVSIQASGGEGPPVIEAKAGTLQARGTRGWEWRAPLTPGVRTLTIGDAADRDRVELNAFVMVPSSEVSGGSLNGYRIGTYPAQAQPRGFIQVTPDNLRTKLSPHFELRQFLCKQPGGFPKYVVLQESLLLKLESVLETLDRSGRDADTLEIMSGYRTPFYNEGIGNVRDSQHTLGTAADVFVDRQHDARMDDLDGDGVVNRRDALWLFGIVDAMDRAPSARWRGGLGEYDSTAAHGPFVHIDVRGRLARWRG